MAKILQLVRMTNHGDSLSRWLRYYEYFKEEVEHKFADVVS